jgi:formamidopyrimidine-DNA glycosylase
MPELPEVETTKKGIAHHIVGQTISQCVIRFPTLRWAIPEQLPNSLPGYQILSVTRRGKYLLIEIETGWLLIHLGMSGTLRVLSTDQPAEKHDHFDLCVGSGKCLRLNDPRRFGAVLWHDRSSGDISEHKLLAKLAPEPLSMDFNADYLSKNLAKRSSPIKSVVMNSQVVVGAGNIYANESLFRSRIHPLKPANSLTQKQAQSLTKNIKEVIARAIEQGGTTLKDFTDPNGKPGYFAQELDVYGRDGQPCHVCGHTIEKCIIQQRASFYCPQCQPKT